MGKEEGIHQRTVLKKSGLAAARPEAQFLHAGLPTDSTPGLRATYVAPRKELSFGWVQQGEKVRQENAGSEGLALQLPALWACRTVWH